MKRSLLAAFIIAILTVCVGYLHGADHDNWTSASDDIKMSWSFGRTYNYSDVLVTRAIDGDTLLLETGERVRLIGIDTPELHQSSKLVRDAERNKTSVSAIQQLGKRSYKFTKDLVEGKKVSVEFDVEKYDKYDRLLAYVYLNGEPKIFVNAEIVKQGYASLMTIPPNVRYADLFQKLYKEARDNKRGLWQ